MAKPAVRFCSQQSLDASESLSGTASRADAWFLLECPAAWPGDVLSCRGLPRSVISRLERLPVEHPSVKQVLIRRSAKRRERIAVHVAVCRESSPILYSRELGSYDELLDLDLAAMIEGRDSAGRTKETESLFLVCTHGTHDKCCALKGLPVYAALRREHAGSTWQSSHLGGDRFAANVVCLPHGVYYGRVPPEDASRVADEYSKRRIVPEYYRGRSCFPAPIQAAEAWVRARTGLLELDALRLVGSRQLHEGVRRVRFASLEPSADHDVVFEESVSGLAQHLTCKAKAPKTVVQYRLLSYSSARSSTTMSPDDKSSPRN